MITVQGPQPLGYITASIDYEHYIDKQVKPIASNVAQVCGIDVNRAISLEPDLFAGLDSR